MSETSPPAAAGAPATPAAAAKPTPMPLMLGIVIGALVAGVALGTLVLGPSLASKHATAAKPASAEDEKKGEHGKEKEGEKPSVHHIENIIVNPAGSEGSHFLMASVAIKVADDKAEEKLRSHDDEIRDRVISVLERQTIESLSAPGARDTLRRQIATATVQFTGTDDPSKIFLPQFVIQ